MSDIDPEDLLRAVTARRFRHPHDDYNKPERYGFAPEDMPYPIRVTTRIPATNPGDPDRVDESIDPAALLALLWLAAQRIDNRMSTARQAIQNLQDRVTALEQAP